MRRDWFGTIVFVVKVKVKHGAPLREPGVSRAHPPLRSAGASLTALGGAFARQPHTAPFCVVAVMMSALKNNASSYLAGRSGGARKPALRTRIFATPGFPFGGSLPLFPARTHADCSRNYEMEEIFGEAGRAPNRRSRSVPDASPSPKPRTKPKTICRRALFPAGSKPPSTSIQATWACGLNLPLLTHLTISWCVVPELN